jgi:hypothetical protein
VPKHENRYLTGEQRAEQKRQLDNYAKRNEGFELFQHAPDEKPLEQQWGISFNSYLIGLEEQSKWVEANLESYWDTPAGKLRTFGDLRAATQRALK